MPTVGVYYDEMQRALQLSQNEEVAEKEFFDLCFTYGLELDEVTNEYEMVRKEKGEAAAEAEYKEKGEDFKRTLWKIDIPANRYDLLCLEGLAKALRVFNQIDEAPVYKVVKPANSIKLTVKASTPGTGRPYMLAAVLRNVKFTKASYDSFIDLQDKLHQNICRRRELVSMGTHDLDMMDVSGVLTYAGEKPNDIVFKPLKDVDETVKEPKVYDARTLVDGYKSHKQMKAYAPLIDKMPVFPCFRDAKGEVASMPPIINSDRTKITLNTTNVFLDVTGVDYTKCNVVLDTLCAMFSQYCANPFEIEMVEVTYDKDFPAGSSNFRKAGDVVQYPKMREVEFEAEPARMRDYLGLHHLTFKEVDDYMKRMMMKTEEMKGSGKLKVTVPCTRTDVMHECDLIEDLAIAYGYGNLKHELPTMCTEIREQPVNKLTDSLRVEFAATGFNECLNFALCSYEDCFDWFRREAKPELAKTLKDRDLYAVGLPAVRLGNPKAKEYNTVRTSMLPGLLKTLESNKRNPLPLRLFEIGDVVVQDCDTETGARNQRRAAAVICSNASQFEVIHGLLDSIMYKLNCRSEVEVADEKEKMQKDIAVVEAKLKKCKDDVEKEKLADDITAIWKRQWKGKVYKLTHGNDPSFIEGMQGDIIVDGKKIGVLGVMRPDVCDPPAKKATDGTTSKAPWAVKNCVSALEFNIEPFLRWLRGEP